MNIWMAFHKLLTEHRVGRWNWSEVLLEELFAFGVTIFLHLLTLCSQYAQQYINDSKSNSRWAWLCINLSLLQLFLMNELGRNWKSRRKFLDWHRNQNWKIFKFLFCSISERIIYYMMHIKPLRLAVSQLLIIIAVAAADDATRWSDKWGKFIKLKTY